MTTSKPAAQELVPRQDSQAAKCGPDSCDFEAIRNAPIDPGFFADCFGQLATVFWFAPTQAQVQVYLDLFREDGWINRHFREACAWMVRNKNRMPSYADFVQWRQAEGLTDE